MSYKPRRDEYAEATRAAIIAAAVAAFTEDGFTGATVGAIAQAARVTKGGVYHHFPGKAALFEAAFAAVEERLVARISAAGLPVADDPWELMSAGVDAFLAECADPSFRRIALQEAPAALGWARWKQLEERYVLPLLQVVLARMSQAGYLPGLPIDLTARALLAALSEVGLAVATSASPDAEREQARQLVRRLLAGLAGHSGASGSMEA